MVFIFQMRYISMTHLRCQDLTIDYIGLTVSFLSLKGRNTRHPQLLQGTNQSNTTNQSQLELYIAHVLEQSYIEQRNEPIHSSLEHFNRDEQEIPTIDFTGDVIIDCVGNRLPNGPMAITLERSPRHENWRMIRTQQYLFSNKC